MARCDFDGGPAVKVAGSLESALSDPKHTYRFVHIAAHGNRERGFEQAVLLPDPLSAVQALRLRWPSSVLIAACHVGTIANEQLAEPYGFVMALLASGAECVAAGLLGVPDDSTGVIVSRVIKSLRGSEQADLATALNAAQRSAADADVQDWALLATFVR